MGAIVNSFPQGTDHIDFAAVKAASLRSVESLVRGWLPAGRRQGDEWVAINPTRGDKKAGSFSINTKTGVWSDFATAETGGDMIDLYQYLFGGNSLDAAREVGEIVGVRPGPRTAQIHTLPTAKRAGAVVAPADILRDPESFPPRTPPDKDGKPRFVVGGEIGPRRRSDELRRHVYKIGTSAVRIKVIRTGGAGALNWYRVLDGEVSGWQLRKPQGFQECPFIGVLDAFDPDPFDPAQATKQLYWPEGERDVETVSGKGALAFSFGGCGDGLPSGCEEYVRDRHLVILADNDPEGVKHAEKKAALATPVAASVRVVHFPDLPPKGDVTDFFQRGGTLAKLDQIAAETPIYLPPANENPASGKKAEAPQLIKATPYSWIAPETIPKRDFVYGKHLVRKFVSATVAPGGVGKSSLIVSETLAMISGQDLLGVHPSGRYKVWLWNLEDPAEEIARHIQATAKHYGIGARDIEGHLFADSGRDQRLIIATTDRNGTSIVQPVVDSIVAEITGRGIDVLIIDPFVSSHQAPENDNGAMDRIVKEWGLVAERGNCAVELVHHSRKNASGETEITVESSRGGKALTDGCRSVRVLNRMSKEEGESAGVENPRVHFRTYIDKGNLAPPAENSDWFKLESVDLGNSPNGGFGDNIGVVIPWKWPDPMADVSVTDLRNVQTLISKGRHRASPQAVDWVGKAVAEAMRLDLDKPADRRKAANLLKVWTASGALQRIEERDDKGNDRPFIVVGEWAT
jgi:AAA domain